MARFLRSQLTDTVVCKFLQLVTLTHAVTKSMPLTEAAQSAMTNYAFTGAINLVETSCALYDWYIFWCPACTQRELIVFNVHQAD